MDSGRMGHGTDASDELEFAKIRERALIAEIDRLKLEYVQRQEWSAKQTEVTIKRLKTGIDRLNKGFISLHTLAAKWVDKDHQDWQELMKLRWGDKLK